MNGIKEEKHCDLILPEACSLFSTNRTKQEVCCSFALFFFYWMNTGTQQADFQNNIRGICYWPVLGRAEWVVTLCGLKSQYKHFMWKDLKYSDRDSCEGVFPPPQAKGTTQKLQTFHIQIFFTLKSPILMLLTNVKDQSSLAVSTNLKHHWSCP